MVGGFATIEFVQQPQCVEYPGLQCLTWIVRLCVLQVGGAEFGNRRATIYGRKSSPIGGPLRNQTVVFLAAPLGAVRPQVDVSAIEVDKGLPGGVLAISGQLSTNKGNRKKVGYLLGFLESCRTSDRRKVCKFNNRLGLYQMGAR